MTIQRKRSTLNGRGWILTYLLRQAGNTAAIFALLLVPIVGALSLGLEASNWWFTSRATQNAADSAALAAANNAVSTEYQTEGRAAAQKYGFVDSTDNTVVTVVTGGGAGQCPDGSTTTCYKATVTKRIPIYLTALTGYGGDTTISGVKYKMVTSNAWAEPIGKIQYPACMTVTGTFGSSPALGLQTKGNPQSAMAGCTIAAIGSNAAVSCNGQGINGSPEIFATSTVASACTSGTRLQNQSASSYIDPYSDLYKKIPCSVSGNTSPNCASGSVSCAAFAGTFTVGSCYSGNISLSADKTVTGSGVVYIQNGNIDLNSHSLTATGGVTFVFTGTSAGSFTGSGNGSALNLIAPTAVQSSDWSGVAGYVDTSHSGSNVSWSTSGNSPKIDIVGLLYLPRTDVDFGGGAGQPAVGTSTCYVAIFHSYSVNGTGLNMQRSGCTAAGLTSFPTVGLTRAVLVQ